MVDLKRVKKYLDGCDWFHRIPVGYHYYEILENDYDLDSILFWLSYQKYGIKFLEDFYSEHSIEWENYLSTLEMSGDHAHDSDYRVRLFLDYFSDIIARKKMENKNFDVPEWLEFMVIF